MASPDFDTLFNIDGTLAPAGCVAVSTAFNRFDLDRDCAWSLQEFNAYQLVVAGEDEVLHDASSMVDLLEAVGVRTCPRVL